jgi:hypothetical protein
MHPCNSQKFEETKCPLIASKSKNIYFNGMKPIEIIKNTCLIAVLVCSATSAVERDTVPIKHHRIQCNPIALLSATLYAQYEYRINLHHALAIEGSYSIPVMGNEGRAFGGMYRYYYKRNNFCGLFINNGNQSMRLPSPERGDTTTYTIDLSYLTIGPNWGKTWYINKRFPLTFRIGAGYPVQNDLTWKNGLKYPTSPKLFETIIRIGACLDGELSIGISF